MIKRFDIVRLKTIERVTWLSGPASRPASTQGNWSVVAGIGDEVLVAKDETIARIPITDIIKVADYGIEHAFNSIKKIRTNADLKEHPLIHKLEKSDGKERQKERRRP